MKIIIFTHENLIFRFLAKPKIKFKHAFMSCTQNPIAPKIYKYISHMNPSGPKLSKGWVLLDASSRFVLQVRWTMALDVSCGERSRRLQMIGHIIVLKRVVPVLHDRDCIAKPEMIDFISKNCCMHIW